MILKVSNSKVSGRITIPGSKSHTIRALFIASLAEGQSEIIRPLISSDALSAVETCRALGADISISSGNDRFIINGTDGMPKTPDDIINVGNSGTTLRFATAAAALGKGYTVFTGDHQIRRRPLGPLLKAINNLGAHAFSTRDNDAAPVVVKGTMKGGRTELDSVTSQYLSAMLVSLPMVIGDSEIHVTRLNEIPYVEMTLWWLDRQGIKYSNNDFKWFHITGRQKYKPFSMIIPSDFSTATFFAVLAAISGEEIIIDNLDMADPQGDRKVFNILESMGAKVSVRNNSIAIKGGELKGMEIDMNSIPDALPAIAVAGCFAQGETRLVNVPQARLKETDRIQVMCRELKKMCACVEELPDGLVVRQSKLKGNCVSGHYDHRVVMALAIAGLNAEGQTIIDTAEAINVTFPGFADLIHSCGGNIEISG